MINYAKVVEEGKSKLLSTIDTHLRYLMLYHAFDKICSEVTENDRSLSVDKGAYQVKSRILVGSILDVEIGLQFFAENQFGEVDQSDSSVANDHGVELIKPRVFKQLLLSVIENANSDTIMRNLGFLLTNKFLE